jgi:hypothetical protein
VQILDIVKATFPNEVYSSDSKATNCDHLDTSGAELACLWRHADELLALNGGTPSSLHKDAIPSLFKASQTPEIWCGNSSVTCIVYNPVNSTCAKSNPASSS